MAWFVCWFLKFVVGDLPACHAERAGESSARLKRPLCFEHSKIPRLLVARNLLLQEAPETGVGRAGLPVEAS